MIRTILFDLGKVLIPFDFWRAYARLEALSGIPAAEVRSRLAATDLFQLFETGLIESSQFADRIQSELGFACGHPEFCGVWTSIFLPEPLLPESLLGALKLKYRLVLVSNTNEIHFEMLHREYKPLLSLFDAFVLSYQVRAMKPAANYYAAALLAAEAPPEACVFIDDLPENVEGARRAGMHGLQFESREKLERDLSALGVSWNV